MMKRWQFGLSLLAVVAFLAFGLFRPGPILGPMVQVQVESFNDELMREQFQQMNVKLMRKLYSRSESDTVAIIGLDM